MSPRLAWGGLTGAIQCVHEPGAVGGLLDTGRVIRFHPAQPPLAKGTPRLELPQIAVAHAYGWNQGSELRGIVDALHGSSATIYSYLGFGIHL